MTAMPTTAPSASLTDAPINEATVCPALATSSSVMLAKLGASLGGNGVSWGASFTAVTLMRWLAPLLLKPPSSTTVKVTVRSSVDGLSELLK